MPAQEVEVILAAPPHQALLLFSNALMQCGATDVLSPSPSSLQFTYFWRSVGRGGMKLKGRMDVVSPDNQQSRGRIGVQIDWNANAGQLMAGGVVFVAMLVLFLLFGSRLGPDMADAGPSMLIVLIIVPIVMVAFIFPRMNRAVAQDLSQKVAQLVGGQTTVASPQAATIAQGKGFASGAPAYAAQSPPPPAPPSAPADSSVFDKIRQLGELRERGLITDADFDNQKDELLKRL